MNKTIYEDGQYLEMHPAWHTEDSPNKVKQILKMIEKNQLQPVSVCEVGCGAGEILNLLHQKMPENVVFTGYEISPQAFDLCRNKKKERLYFFLEDITQAKINNKFELLLLIDVFEHIEDYLGFLRKVKEKGDYKIFRIPLDLSVNSVRNNSFLISRKKWGHLHAFTKDSAIESLKFAGYEIIDYFYDKIEHDYKKSNYKSSLINLFRRILSKYDEDITVRLLGGSFLIVLAR